MNFKRCPFAFIFLMVFFLSGKVHAQRIYSTSTPSASDLVLGWPVILQSYVLNKDNAADSDLSNYAYVYAANADAWLQLKFTNEIPAGKTTFVRIDIPNITKENLSAIVGIEAFKNSSAGNDGQKLTTAIVTLLAQNTQETFLAITPSEAYNSVRITIRPSNTANIYYAYTGNNLMDCGAGWTAAYSTNTTSTTVSALTAVTNSTSAVDGNSLTYSTINIDGTQKDVTISHTIFFSSLSKAGELVRIYVAEPAGLSRNSLSATIQPYNNSTPVGPALDIFSVLPLSSAKIPLEISPPSPIDRIVLKLTSSSNANRNYSLNVYEAQILPSKPVLNVYPVIFCQNETRVLSVSNPVSGLDYKWYESGNLLSSPSTSYSPTSLSVGLHNIIITASRPGCIESTPESISIEVSPKPITPNIQPIN